MLYILVLNSASFWNSVAMFTEPGGWYLTFAIWDWTAPSSILSSSSRWFLVISVACTAVIWTTFGVCQFGGCVGGGIVTWGVCWAWGWGWWYCWWGCGGCWGGGGGGRWDGWWWCEGWGWPQDWGIPWVLQYSLLPFTLLCLVAPLPPLTPRPLFPPLLKWFRRLPERSWLVSTEVRLPLSSEVSPLCVTSTLLSSMSSSALTTWIAFWCSLYLQLKEQSAISHVRVGIGSLVLVTGILNWLKFKFEIADSLNSRHRISNLSSISSHFSRNSFSSFFNLFSLTLLPPLEPLLLFFFSLPFFPFILLLLYLLKFGCCSGLCYNLPRCSLYGACLWLEFTLNKKLIWDYTLL